MSEAEQNAEGLKRLEALMRGEKTQDAMANQVGGTKAAERAKTLSGNQDSFA